MKAWIRHIFLALTCMGIQTQYRKIQTKVSARNTFMLYMHIVKCVCVWDVRSVQSYKCKFIATYINSGIHVYTLDWYVCSMLYIFTYLYVNYNICKLSCQSSMKSFSISVVKEKNRLNNFTHQQFVVRKFFVISAEKPNK